MIHFIKSPKGRNLNYGFTLIELLVVISIIGILSSTVLTSLTSAKKKANIARAKSDLNQLRTAIILLENDTGLHPGKLTPTPCVQNPEVYFDSCEAGIRCTDGNFPNWGGPYMNQVPVDPWGTNYYFDSDYGCNGQMGCESIPTNTITRAIVSFGPDKVEDYSATSDDVALVLCR